MLGPLYMYTVTALRSVHIKPYAFFNIKTHKCNMYASKSFRNNLRKQLNYRPRYYRAGHLWYHSSYVYVDFPCEPYPNLTVSLRDYLEDN